jgi:diacylglycerol kinase (ATP)
MSPLGNAGFWNNQAMVSGKTGVTGLRRIWNAFFYSAAGLRSAWRHESAFRQECLLAAVLIPAAFWLGTSPTDYALLIGSVVLLLITELLNSAIEAVVDRVGTERNTLSGQAKDMGSAAVFLALVLIVVVWGAIAWQRLRA